MNQAWPRFSPVLRLKGNLDRELRLAWIADARPQEAVEVEQGRRAERVDVVGVVEGVEHLEHRRDLVAAAKPERPSEPPVEREELVVLAFAVAAAIDAVQHSRGRGDRLG